MTSDELLDISGMTALDTVSVATELIERDLVVQGVGG